MTGFIPVVIPAKAEIQNVGTHRITRTSFPWISGSSPKITIKKTPKDDNTKNCLKKNRPKDRHVKRPGPLRKNPVL